MYCPRCGKEIKNQISTYHLGERVRCFYCSKCERELIIYEEGDTVTVEYLPILSDEEIDSEFEGKIEGQVAWSEVVDV